MEEFKVFLKQFPSKSFDKDDVIIPIGGEVESVHLIKSGFVRVYNTDNKGEKNVIYIVRQPEVFPLDWIWSKASVSTCNYVAHTSCQVILIPKTDYIGFLKTHLDFLVARHEMMINIYLELADRVYGLTHHKATDKVLRSLEYFVSRFEVQKKSQQDNILLPITQQELASFIGLTRETVNATLQKLKSNGIVVDSKQPGIMINCGKLQKSLQIQNPNE